MADHATLERCYLRRGLRVGQQQNHGTGPAPYMLSRAGEKGVPGGHMSAHQEEGPRRSGARNTRGAVAREPIAAAILADWSTLVQRLERRLYRYFRHLPASREETCDMVCNVLVTVYAAAREAPPDTDLAPVVEATAREEGARYMRRLRHEQPIGDRNDLPVADSTERARATAREQTWRRLKALLAGLPEVQRLIVERRLDDVPYAAIAAELGYEEGSVKTLRNRAMHQLRRQSKGFVPPIPDK